MALLTSRTARFARSFDYKLSELRPTQPTAHKKKISVAVPATHHRGPDQKDGRKDHRN